MWLLHMASTAILTGDSHMTNPRVACGGHMTREVTEGKNLARFNVSYLDIISQQFFFIKLLVCV